MQISVHHCAAPGIVIPGLPQRTEMIKWTTAAHFAATFSNREALFTPSASVKKGDLDRRKTGGSRPFRC